MSNKTKNQLIEMFTLQNKLNINTNGERWKEGYTKEGRQIDWFRCIYMETAEAIDSLNWKHWKDINRPDNTENLKIELVDILHFIMSQFIKQSIGNVNSSIGFLEELIEEEQSSSDIPIIICLENLLLEAAKSNIEQATYFYVQILKHPNYQDKWNFQEIYALYIGKNCLNQFRQDNGYKNGTYKKIWNGKEDNVYMQDYISGNQVFNYHSIYNYLVLEYKNVGKK